MGAHEVASPGAGGSRAVLRSIDLATSALVSLTRFRSGNAVGPIGARPEHPLQLYEFEACPFCRKVREALSILDLDVIVLPCPKNGPRYRAEAEIRGGKTQFPFLVDPNTGVECYESDAIVEYLFEHYGETRPPRLLRPGPLNDATTMAANLWRPGLGAFYRNARPPAELLELYGYEASAACRLVRERLCCLELPYALRNAARGSATRAMLAERSGVTSLPYLVDPNTDAALGEVGEILRYLDRTYRESA